MEKRWGPNFGKRWCTVIAVSESEMNLKRLVLSLCVVGILVLAVAACGPLREAAPSQGPATDPTELPTEVPTPVPEVPTPIPTEAPIPLPSAHVAVLGTICDDSGCNADTLERPDDGMVMVYVPAGEFEMGSADGNDDAQPVHTVALNGFWIDTTEVTYAQHQRCQEAGVCERPPEVVAFAAWDHYDNENYADHPIWKVTWAHADAYCGWVGARLPTEAEWEYTARGSDGYTYPWGNSEPDCDKANHTLSSDVWCVGGTSPVGSHPNGASWCGTQDMAGNVSEWVADWYAADYYAASPSMNPTGPPSGTKRVIRGGHENAKYFSMRGYTRVSAPPDLQPGAAGFRCAMDVE